MMIAQGLAPMPIGEKLALLVCLLQDADPEISRRANQTISEWNEEEILAQLQSRDCPVSVLEHFGRATNPASRLQAIIANPSDISRLEFEISPGDLALEGLPAERDERQTTIANRLSKLSVREKIRYALFGTREIRAVLVRDPNKEVARNVLHSPKLTENEIESIAAMRSVADDILREIGNSKEWTKSYAVVQNLVKNPKTPPLVSQRLMNRLHTQDLTLLSRDRSISDAVRHQAARVLKQRTAARPGV